jgi:toxin-antitoxin system PIN domain toxin
MTLVDANVLLAASNRSSEAHAACRRAVEELAAGAAPWHATWGILYEFVRVTTHRRVLPRPYTNQEAWSFVQALLDTPSFHVLVETERHGQALQGLLEADPELRGSALHDVQTAALMREHGVRRILTRDFGFHRFTWLEVVDPLRARGS